MCVQYGVWVTNFMNKWLPKSLYRQILLVLIVCFFAVFLLLIYLIPKISQSYQQEIMQNMHGHVAGYVVDHYLLSENGELKLEEAKSVFHNLMILGANFEFYILDLQGEIKAFSAEPNKVVRERVNLTPIREYLNTDGDIAPILGDDPRQTARQKVFSVAPIMDGDNLKGYLYVVIGSQIYDTAAAQVFGSSQLQWGFWGALIGLAFCLFMGLFLTRLSTRPLRTLTRAVDANKNSILTGFEEAIAPLPEPRSNVFPVSEEVATLTQSFNALIGKMAEQFADLKNLHELRRELVAHISHDLRSPLASLMGYLETWQIQKNNLSSEQSNQYVGIALRNAKKMNNLIEQLFELAHLESGDVKVDIEPFSIAELAQDVLQKFALTAEKKQVQLQVTPQETHILVMGDVEKLERVLSNLVDNALRHTQVGGTITIRLSEQGHLVAVEVNDTGIGMARNELSRIFDAHYKAENSVRGNTSNAGLGLAITKKLLALHDCSIQVSSEQGKGTSFKFALPGPESRAA